MTIPFCNLKKEWSFFERRFTSKLIIFGKTGSYVLGEEVENFEQEFARYLGYKYVSTVSSGLSALEISLRAMGIAAGDEVITVSNSAVATSLAISNVGAKPVFCDIRKDFLIDVTRIENLITPKTRCILPVHLFGRICDMKEINRIAKKHSLKVLEDACQAHGSAFGGPSGINTKAFSFYPTKNLGAMGEGGAVATNDKNIAEFVRSYRNYGQNGRYYHVIKGTNARMDPLKCALLRIKLKKLDLFIFKRRYIASKYIDKLKDCSFLSVADFDKDSSYHLFVIRVLGENRDKLMQHLHNSGIETLIHYPTLIHKQPCYKDEYIDTNLLLSEQYQREIISLPCYPFLKQSEQSTIIKAIKNFDPIL
jgi:dTDP-4-amino-4,6-dideoxygalactose transaminase